MFQDARVLDIMGARGLWTLAALDAGAAHVVCVTSPESAEVAREGLRDYGFNQERHQVVNLADSRKFDPGSFDLVLCGRYFERSDPRLFFADLHRSLKRAYQLLADLRCETWFNVAVLIQGATYSYRPVTGTNKGKAVLARRLINEGNHINLLHDIPYL